MLLCVVGSPWRKLGMMIDVIPYFVGQNGRKNCCDGELKHGRVA